MPRTRKNGQGPSGDRLYEAAAGQAGYVTLPQVRESGYSSPLLEYHVRQGHLERVARGVFRLAHFPAGENEDLVVAWLWSRRLGVFSHETALVLHDLSDALPARQHLTVPGAWRKRRLRVPENVVLHFADIPLTERTWQGAVPVTTPLRTIADCKAGHVPPDIVAQATQQGIRRGLFRREELRRTLRTPARKSRSAR
ncbi:MAG: type IV toxin-antitoxin system AbiEi family antitoxin domain-containing protein [Myxococcaceae bacterium]